MKNMYFSFIPFGPNVYGTHVLWTTFRVDVFATLELWQPIYSHIDLCCCLPPKKSYYIINDYRLEL